MWRVVLGVFLVLHGLIHLGYLSPALDDPKFPFDLRKSSWLTTGLRLGESFVRPLGTALAVLTVLGFALSGLAANGLVIPQAWWQPLTVIAAGVSLLLLILFWHRSLVVGVAIDVVLLAALLGLHWNPLDIAGR